MEFEQDKTLKRKIDELINRLGFDHIKTSQISVFRSKGSTAKARARIYGLPRIWQQALGIKPHYCIEFISEHFDQLKESDKLKVMIHELMHIPKTFSGALRPHRGKYRRPQVTAGKVEELFSKLNKKC